MIRAGSAVGSAASVMSCPCTFFSMSAWIRSRTSSWYCVGSNVSRRDLVDQLLGQLQLGLAHLAVGQRDSASGRTSSA